MPVSYTRLFELMERKGLKNRKPSSAFLIHKVLADEKK